MSLGIPYMGSKRKIASEILHFITSRHTGIADFYDLFAGGGAISFMAIKDYRFNVHYNEINSHIYSLVEYLKTHRELEPKFYEWVTRDTFFQQLSRTDADWYSGYFMTCWSFGNNSEKGYLYGSHIEEMKRLGHELVVNKCAESMRLLGLNIPELANIDGLQKRRIIFCDHVKKLIERKDLYNVERIQNLELIEHLSRLQNLQNLQNLQITNASYENVLINSEQPIIYCDIPYQSTSKYKDTGFDYDKFYQWANDINYPVYVSEYSSPLNQVHAFIHRSTLSATVNNKTVEKLFWNGKGDINKTNLFS